MGAIYDRTLSNLKKSLQPKELGNTLIDAVAGSLAYWAAPTLGERLFNTDMTGAKGATLGVVTGLGTSFATGRSGIAAATLGSFFTHLSYVYNDKTVDFLGKYNWRLAHGTEMPQIGTMNDGETITLPDGQSATAYNPLNPTVSSLPQVASVSLPATPVSDYLSADGSPLHDYLSADGKPLSDYLSADGRPLNDYLTADGNSLNDYLTADGNSLSDNDNPFNENFGGY
jgi:hypothetical protein